MTKHKFLSINWCKNDIMKLQFKSPGVKVDFWVPEFWSVLALATLRKGEMQPTDLLVL